MALMGWGQVLDHLEIHPDIIICTRWGHNRALMLTYFDHLSFSLLQTIIFSSDFCGAKMLLLQSQDTTDALTCLWRLKLTKLQENMTTPLLITRWNFKGMSETKLPITSDVPEGCTIIREHIPITNLFTCLWFNEVDDFTSRDQCVFRVAYCGDWKIGSMHYHKSLFSGDLTLKWFIEAKE
ncbi:uncharacterized protein LOC116107614 [Pistacia vera]|uniref:uncharacterized protein LOC116107614 n=1 Tax=Pistacia vera TaxID=55513 RepID=UPI0012633559|nr:uncharacterized protein LOC116107614 [Pistacia vera]